MKLCKLAVPFIAKLIIGERAYISVVAFHFVDINLDKSTINQNGN